MLSKPLFLGLLVGSAAADAGLPSVTLATKTDGTNCYECILGGGVPCLSAATDIYKTHLTTVATCVAASTDCTGAVANAMITDPITDFATTDYMTTLL